MTHTQATQLITAIRQKRPTWQTHTILIPDTDEVAIAITDDSSTVLLHTEREYAYWLFQIKWLPYPLPCADQDPGRP